MKAEGCREWRERIGALVLGQLPEDGAVRHRGPPRGLSRVPRRGRGARPGGPAAGARRSRPARAGARAPAAARGADRPPDRGGAPRRTPQADAASGLVWRGAAAAAAAAVVVRRHRGLGPEHPPRPSPSDRCRAAPPPRPPSRPARGEARSASRCTAFGPAPSARCGCAARRQAGPRRVVSLRLRGRGRTRRLSSAVAPDDATAVGLRVGSKTYVAPLPSRSPAAGAWLIPSRPQEDT